MSKTTLQGEAVTFQEMLNAREQRVLIQRRLLEKYSNCGLVSITMNIPGPIKTNDQIKNIFFQMIEEIEMMLSKKDIYFKEYQELKTGLECYLIVKENVLTLKKKMVQLEEIHLLGRLMDLDVLYRSDESLHSISRTELGFKPRRCFVCGENAKICGRMSRHQLNELYQVIDEMIQKGKME